MVAVAPDNDKFTISKIREMVKRAIEEENRSFLTEILGIIDRKIDKNNSDLSDITNKIIAFQNTPDRFTGDPKKISESLNDEKDSMEAEINNLNEQKLIIVEELRKYKNFDKVKTIDNIRYLLKENPDVKIGMIEKNANVGAGYLSRIDKVGNLTDPSIEFIVTAAKMLNVSVDYLMFADFESESQNLTPNDLTVFQFVNSLYDDTVVGMLDWSEYDLRNIERRLITDRNYSAYPLLNYRIDDNNNRGAWCEFKSSFWGQYKWDVVHMIYNTNLNKMNAKAYIIPIKYFVNSNSVIDEYEIYIWKNETLIPICSTYKIKNMIKDKIMELYRKISMYNTGIQLNGDAKSFLDTYLNTPEYGELPFK